MTFDEFLFEHWPFGRVEEDCTARDDEGADCIERDARMKCRACITYEYLHDAYESFVGDDSSIPECRRRWN